MQESLSPKHGRELLGHPLEHFLNGGGITDESGGHFEALGGDIAHRRLNVVGDPLHEIRGILVLDVQHLLVNFLGRHPTSEHRGSG